MRLATNEDIAALELLAVELQLARAVSVADHLTYAPKQRSVFLCQEHVRVACDRNNAIPQTPE